MLKELKSFLVDKLGTRYWWVPIALFPLGIVGGVLYIILKLTMWGQNAKIIAHEKKDVVERKDKTERELKSHEVVREAEEKVINAEAEADKAKAEAVHTTRTAEITHETDKDKRRIASSDSAADDAVDDLLN